jgi:transcriptional regulator with XRE-family HTH domain
MFVRIIMLERILEIFDKSGMTDSAICKALPLGNGTVGKWRNGLQKPSTDAIVKISNYFDVSTDYILLGNDSKLASSLSDEDAEWIDLIHKLPAEARYEFRGEIKGYLRRIEEESQEREEPLKQAK